LHFSPPGMPLASRHSGRSRMAFVDVLRGLAIAMMFAYHFSFDLNFFGAIDVDFNRSPFWLGFRAVIVSSFLLLVGVSLVLAHGRRVAERAFWARLAKVAACAALVSFASRMMFPNSMIFFGILHFIAVASVVGVVCLRLGDWTLPAGIVAIAVGLTVTNPLFDRPELQWFGLMTHKPVTEDYVPFLPWFGVVLIGMYVGTLLPRLRDWTALSQWAPRGPLGRALALAGSHSLPVYMLHQPVFLSLLYLFFRVA
jgi:uncharacterized membrane protein